MNCTHQSGSFPLSLFLSQCIFGSVFLFLTNTFYVCLFDLLVNTPYICLYARYLLLILMSFCYYFMGFFGWGDFSPLLPFLFFFLFELYSFDYNSFYSHSNIYPSFYLSLVVRTCIICPCSISFLVLIILTSTRERCLMTMDLWCDFLHHLPFEKK